MDASVVDEGPARYHGWPGPNPSSVTNTTPRLWHAPADLRIVRPNFDQDKNSACPISSCPAATRSHPGESYPGYYDACTEGRCPRRIGAAGLHNYQDLRSKDGLDWNRAAPVRGPPPLAPISAPLIFTQFSTAILRQFWRATSTPSMGSRVVSQAGRQLLQDSEDHGYKVIGTVTQSYVATDPRFGVDVLDIVPPAPISDPH
ncbi:hypothetical protein EVAR_98543_1 [Eumeta japonica]|uniref:Uncharacterized protein n=1 Tax=Eumeta variegata TaxID=151549 RepID=A0A4C1YKQ8_EUMVA|nr:hypothetical protein EVAR_98543_1 [Eumeta japonica]